MKALCPIVIAMLVCGCGEHSLPREADAPSDAADINTIDLEELDSVSRAAVLMMRDCFEMIDSSMKTDGPDAVRAVPAIDLDEVEGHKTDTGSTKSSDPKRVRAARHPSGQ